MYNYGYNYGYDYDSLTGASVGLAAIGSMLIISLIILLVVAVLQIVAMWKIFTKAGEAGWKSIIPVYNIITLFLFCAKLYRHFSNIKTMFWPVFIRVCKVLEKFRLVI